MDKTEFELVVSPGRQPIYFLALAAIFFSAMLYHLYDVGIICYRLGFNDDTMKLVAASSKVVVFCLVFGIRFSMIKDVLIDVDTHLLISRYRVGPFSRDIRSKCPHLEYIAVFRNAKDMYEVNLWYKGNRHYKMYEFEETEPAFEFARLASAKLKLDLLDATVKGDSKWLEHTTQV